MWNYTENFKDFIENLYDSVPQSLSSGENNQKYALFLHKATFITYRILDQIYQTQKALKRRRTVRKRVDHRTREGMDAKKDDGGSGES